MGLALVIVYQTAADTISVLFILSMVCLESAF